MKQEIWQHFLLLNIDVHLGTTYTKKNRHLLILTGIRSVCLPIKVYGLGFALPEFRKLRSQDPGDFFISRFLVEAYEFIISIISKYFLL